MIPILILTAILAAFHGPIVTDVGGGVPTVTTPVASSASVDDVGGGVPTH
ncbi:MAG TPA: hypothetical protein VGU66_06085 [Candidatus Elarobacter sp.]|nr:hypothetical protein [Candidatus Elarobacter sp.]